jgi:hypothetical protein
MGKKAAVDIKVAEELYVFDVANFFSWLLST